MKPVGQVPDLPSRNLVIVHGANIQAVTAGSGTSRARYITC